MKFMLMTILLSSSFQVLAMSNSEERLKFLENRVRQLESRLAKNNKRNAVNGLKVKDMNNTNVERSVSGDTSQGSPSITAKQQEEIMKQIEAFKKKRSESQKMLDELMKDEF